MPSGNLLASRDPKTKEALTETARQIEEEMIRRELARRHLLDFADYVFPNYLPGPPHVRMAQELEWVERELRAGRDVRLIISVPPQTGKSELTSRLFPAWVLGRNPDWRLMLTSYGADLAQEHSRNARNYLGSQDYANLFGTRATRDDPIPVELAGDSKSVHSWSLLAPHRGQMVAAGVRGPLTGKGFTVGIIDDPIKDQEDADSELLLQKQIAWYHSTFYTRRAAIGPSAIIIVMTRWSERDLAGYVKAQAALGDQYDQWREVRIPALSEAPSEDDALTVNLAPDALERATPGLSYWPAARSAEALKRLEENTPKRIWAALYQQRPRPAEGNLIKRHWFQYIDAAPTENVEWVRYWDLATTKKKIGKHDPDWTAGALVGRWRYRDGQDIVTRFVVADMQADRNSPANIQELIRNTARADGYEVPIYCEIVGQFESFFQQLLDDEDLWGYDLKPDRPQPDKVARALPWIGRLELGRVFLVGNVMTPWILRLLAIAVEFPFGAHEDDIDAISGGYNTFLPDPKEEEFVGSAAPLIVASPGWNKGKKK